VSRRAEVQVGIAMLAAAAILIVSVVWLKEMSVAGASRVWKVSFPEVGGLSRSDEVQVNGIRKGQVDSMTLEGDSVLVELKLAGDVTITRDSRVVIRNVGLMGEKVIFVDLKRSGAPYTTADVIRGEYEQGLGEVMGQLGQTVSAVSDLSAQLSEVASTLQKDGQLDTALRNFRTTSEELRMAVEENRALFGETVRNFAATSRTAKSLTVDRETQLKKGIDDFASAAEKLDRLSGRLDSLRAVMQSLSSRVDRGEGTLGKLVTDEKLYDDLNTSVASLRALIEDVKRNPKKYFKFSVF